MQTDSRGNTYIESDLGIDQAVRVTRVENGWNGGICIRLSVKDENNKVRQGPEFPIENSVEIIEAIKKLSQPTLH